MACGHAFCTECIRDLLGTHPFPHHVRAILCPFHNSSQSFTPRLLPMQSGYRVLSLDGGGANGLAELIILRHIETRCFQIPTKHLYDLIVGTSMGGVTALALTMPSGNSRTQPLTVTEATRALKDIARNGLVEEDPGILGWFFQIFWAPDKAISMAKSYEEELRRHFGKTTTLHDVPTHLEPFSTPNVAVTTEALSQNQLHLVAN
jgi:predicted acylesterase/phospholipase RssA